MSKPDKKIEAHSLRKKGWSIKDIANHLSVSRASVSVWCREIMLSKKQKEILFAKQIASGHKGRLLGAEMNRQKRLQAITVAEKQARNFIGDLSRRDLLMLGIGLYWGEGVKSQSSAFALVNSNPKIILQAKRWLQECLDVDTVSFRPYLYINEQHEKRSAEILKYWSQYLKIPKEQFHSPFIVKQRNIKYYSNSEQYYGVLALRVAKGTALKYRVLAMIEACSPN